MDVTLFRDAMQEELEIKLFILLLIDLRFRIKLTDSCHESITINSI